MDCIYCVLKLSYENKKKMVRDTVFSLLNHTYSSYLHLLHGRGFTSNNLCKYV